MRICIRMVLAIAATTAVVGMSESAWAASRGIQAVAVSDRAGQRIAFYKESHALVVGVSGYNNGWPSLPGVRKDVTQVREVLEEQGFDVTEVNDPTRRELEDAYRDFIGRYGQDPDNRLLFYFAGHGHSMTLGYGGKMGYLVARDAPRPDQDKLGFKNAALSMQVIETYARNIESKHALFVFDACFAGSVFDATRALPETIARKTGSPVRQFITSGTAEQEVPDDSVFRGQFVAALRGDADADRDGYVTGSELGQFLEKQVTSYTQGAQTPRYGKLRDPLLDKGDFVFALGTAPDVPETVPEPVRPSQGSGGSSHAIELAYWDTIKDSKDRDLFDAYLKKFPTGHFSDLARIKLARLQEPATKKPAAREPAVPTLTNNQKLDGAWMVDDVAVVFEDGQVSLFEDGRYEPDEKGTYQFVGDKLSLTIDGDTELFTYTFSSSGSLHIKSPNEDLTLQRIGAKNSGLTSELSGRWVQEQDSSKELAFEGRSLRVYQDGSLLNDAPYGIYGNELFIWADSGDTHLKVDINGNRLTLDGNDKSAFQAMRFRRLR